MRRDKILTLSSFLLPLKMLIRSTSPILLYHSIFNESPSELRGILDNVYPNILRYQLRILKSHYKVISVDDYIKLRDKRGYACVTFDDAYQNVIKNGLAVFEELNIPVTIFVNTSTLENKVFWRDKIRYIINNNLVSEFEKFSKNTFQSKERGLYKYTKMKGNNSRIVEGEIDLFFDSLDIAPNLENYCVNSKQQFFKHELISYGNHTHNHYVLSSLSVEEQYDEVKKAKDILSDVNVNQSKLFSLPFGGNEDYNMSTIDILKELDYEGMLMSRNRINTYRNDFLHERFMPRENDLINIIKKLSLKELLMFCNN